MYSLSYPTRVSLLGNSLDVTRKFVRAHYAFLLQLKSLIYINIILDLKHWRRMSPSVIQRNVIEGIQDIAQLIRVAKISSKSSYPSPSSPSPSRYCDCTSRVSCGGVVGAAGF